MILCVTVRHRAFGTPTHQVIPHTLPKHLRLRMPNSGCWTSSEQPAARERIAEPPSKNPFPCSLPLPTHFSGDKKQLHAAYASESVQDLSSPYLTTPSPAAPPGQRLRVPPEGRPEAGAAVPGAADKARPRRGQSRSRGATRRGGAGRGCPGAGVEGTIKSRVPGGSGAVRSVQLRSLGSGGLDLLGGSEYGQQHGRLGCKCRGEAGRVPGPCALFANGVASGTRSRVPPPLRPGRAGGRESMRPTERRGPQSPL